MPVVIRWHPTVCQILHHSPFLKMDLFLVATCDSLPDKSAPSMLFYLLASLSLYQVVMKARIKFRQEEYHQMKNIQFNSSDTSDCDSIIQIL